MELSTTFPSNDNVPGRTLPQPGELDAGQTHALFAGDDGHSSIRPRINADMVCSSTPQTTSNTTHAHIVSSQHNAVAISSSTTRTFETAVSRLSANQGQLTTVTSVPKSISGRGNVTQSASTQHASMALLDVCESILQTLGSFGKALQNDTNRVDSAIPMLSSIIESNSTQNSLLTSLNTVTSTMKRLSETRRQLHSQRIEKLKQRHEHDCMELQRSHHQAQGAYRQRLEKHDLEMKEIRDALTESTQRLEAETNTRKQLQQKVKR